MIQIVCVGKKHESWVQAGIERYQTRLRAPWDVRWELLPHSSHSGPSARQDESERLLRRLDEQSYVILLDETGQQFDSPKLTQSLIGQLDYGKTITIIIGGAYGVDQSVRDRADLVWSLSPLVFPHQLVRLILVEQLYRCSQIAAGSSYHHQ